MAYQHKTEIQYYIIWNDEEIDQFDTWDEALKMKKEYNLAFGGGCFIRKKREKIAA